VSLLSARARVVALGSGAALVLGFVAWAGPLYGLVLSLPLLLVLRGLWRAQLYTAKWGSLLLVFYTALLMAEAYAIRSRHWIALGLSAIAAIQFVALNLYVRWSAREAAASP
jgi:uncharacterized membrane protein